MTIQMVDVLKIYIETWGSHNLVVSLWKLANGHGVEVPPFGEKPDNLRTISNLVKVLIDKGKLSEADITRWLIMDGELDYESVALSWHSRSVSGLSSTRPTVPFKRLVSGFTPKALLLADPRRPSVEEWFPLSQLVSSDIVPEVGKIVVFQLSEWLANKKGITPQA